MRSKCILLLLLTAVVYSQSYTGSISGRVLDKSGLAIPKATVTITEESTNTISRLFPTIPATTSRPI